MSRFVDKIQRISVSKDDYLLEWNFIGRDTKKQCKCLCNRPITNVNYFVNNVTFKCIMVGDDCKKELKLDKHKNKTHELIKKCLRKRGEYPEIKKLLLYSSNVLEEVKKSLKKLIKNTETLEELQYLRRFIHHIGIHDYDEMIKLREDEIKTNKLLNKIQSCDLEELYRLQNNTLVNGTHRLKQLLQDRIERENQNVIKNNIYKITNDDKLKQFMKDHKCKLIEIVKYLRNYINDFNSMKNVGHLVVIIDDGILNKQCEHILKNIIDDATLEQLNDVIYMNMCNKLIHNRIKELKIEKMTNTIKKTKKLQELYELQHNHLVDDTKELKKLLQDRIENVRSNSLKCDIFNISDETALKRIMKEYNCDKKEIVNCVCEHIYNFNSMKEHGKIINVINDERLIHHCNNTLKKSIDDAETQEELITIKEFIKYINVNNLIGLINERISENEINSLLDVIDDTNDLLKLYKLQDNQVIKKTPELQELLHKRIDEVKTRTIEQNMSKITTTSELTQFMKKCKCNLNDIIECLRKYIALSNNLDSLNRIKQLIKIIDDADLRNHCNTVLRRLIHIVETRKELDEIRKFVKYVKIDLATTGDTSTKLDELIINRDTDIRIIAITNDVQNTHDVRELCKLQQNKFINETPVLKKILQRRINDLKRCIIDRDIHDITSKKDLNNIMKECDIKDIRKYLYGYMDKITNKSSLNNMKEMINIIDDGELTQYYKDAHTRIDNKY
jgi:hypothetical protein